MSFIVPLSVPVNGQTFNFKVTDEGHVFIDGQRVAMSISTNSHYPGSKGYKMFIYKGIKFFFIIEGTQIKIIPLVQQSGKSPAMSNGNMITLPIAFFI